MKYLVRTTVQTYWEDGVEAETEEAACAKAHDMVLEEISDDMVTLSIHSEVVGVTEGDE